MPARAASRLFVDLIAGARPNFIKLAPVARALSQAGLPFRLVHTGQHYDPAMNDVFFADLDIPHPDVSLDVGSGSHGAQTARILERYEALVLQERPSATVVFGDVNSTVACALAAAKLGIPIAHVEAGLRSLDRAMPEEINRILTDAMADLLLVSEASGLEHLKREGVPESKMQLVGNVMIDTLLTHLPAARQRRAARTLGVESGYGFVTLHRPSNVDDPRILSQLLDLLVELAASLPLVFAVHPRTLAAARAAGFGGRLDSASGALKCVGPQPYLDALSLMADARVVLTDSGGMQEETTVLGIPCLTLRDNTERPVTLELGTSRLVGNRPQAIREAFDDAIAGRWPQGRPIPMWDGEAASRIAAALAAWLRFD